MPPEDNPRDSQETYPCDCGGEFTLDPGCKFWRCDECGDGFKATRRLEHAKGLLEKR